MKNDYEVKLYMSERRKGMTQQQAAARAGMSERTARKYEQAGALPSALKRPHEWQTRSNPFEEDWPWVVEQLERDPALQSTTLFALLCERHPDRYRPTQDRTLRRHIARWRVLHGPEKDIIFEQVHTPGERAQSDFTHMEDLGVTIAGEPFPHMVRDRPNVVPFLSVAWREQVGILPAVVCAHERSLFSLSSNIHWVRARGVTCLALGTAATCWVNWQGRGREGLSPGLSPRVVAGSGDPATGPDRRSPAPYPPRCGRVS